MFGLVPILLTWALPLLAAAHGPGFKSHPPSQWLSTCQKSTANPLDGCLPHTIYVSQTDNRAHFKTVQSAIASIPHDKSPSYILIAPGNYTEQLNITLPGPLYLLGMSDYPHESTQYADIDYNTKSNDVQIWWNSANNNGRFTDNVYTSVLTIAPTLNASLTGSGPTGFPVPANTPFGSSDFRPYNIDFCNDYANFGDGPSHALSVSRANAGFYSCGFYSYQHTLYVGKLGNAYFYDNIIAGETDFLYGFGTAYIEKSAILFRNCGGGLTAWKGTNTTFTNKYGVYISDSTVLAANQTILATKFHSCALGRPWNAQHRSVVINTYLDSTVLPAGYIIWGTQTPNFNNYTYMAMSDNYGPGVNITAEQSNLYNGLNVTIVLDDAGVGAYRWPVDVFQTEDGKLPNIDWIDHSVLVGPRW